MTQHNTTTQKHPGVSRIDRDQAAVVMIDHQSGLLTMVRDIEPHAFMNNVKALAEIARYFDLPTILTTSFEEGPNGPLLPELRRILPDATYVPRPGQVNAWDHDEFVATIKDTGRRQLLLAGVTTDVCVAFPALSAIAAGYEVFVISDACGAFNELSRGAAWIRMASAGVHLMTWFSALGELMRDWREDVEGLGALISEHSPEYRHLIALHTDE